MSLITDFLALNKATLLQQFSETGLFLTKHKNSFIKQALISIIS